MASTSIANHHPISSYASYQHHVLNTLQNKEEHFTKRNMYVVIFIPTNVMYTPKVLEKSTLNVHVILKNTHFNVHEVTSIILCF